MKKNISINISGIIFHIEEDGYDNLRRYLDSINKYFSSFEDSSEIMADIESRIAEIFLSKLSEGKQIITSEDVNALIATMGSVSDFKAAEEQEFAQAEPKVQQEQTQTSSSTSGSYSSSTSTQGSTQSKKFVRDQQRKILGGVCAGLANYLNVDAVWVRLVFALLAFAWGITILLYIILWIVVPGAYDLQEIDAGKKMYRDPEHKVIGGVSGGLASFLNIDIVAVRVLFILFTFIGGLGLFVYIILWVILPEAKTITERMQMQGEPVTLSNIESNIKKNQGVTSNEDESTLTKIILFPFRLIGIILQALGKIIVPIVEVLRVAIGIIVILIGLSFLFATVITGGVLLGIFTSATFGESWGIDGIPFDTFVSTFPGWLVAASIIAALIPSIVIILLGASAIARRIVFNSTFGWSMFVVFFVCVAILSVGIPKIVLSFREQGEYQTELVFNPTGKRTLLKLNHIGMDDYHGASLNLEGHAAKEFKLVQVFHAQGSSFSNAAENAKMITYNVTSQDSVITFDNNIQFKPDAAFRAQRLRMILYIPYEKPFLMDEGMSRFIEEYVDYEYQSGNTWKMTEKGLECITCPKDEENKDDRTSLTDFTELELHGIFDVRIKRGDEFAVELNGPENEKRKYTIYRSGETLIVDFEGKKRFNWDNKFDKIVTDEVIINITMPVMEKLEATGFGSIRFDQFNSDDMEIEIQGPIKVRGELNVDDLYINLSAKAEADLNGHVDKMNADLEFASSLNAYDLETVDAVVEAKGACKAKVNVTGTLEIEEGMASDVDYRGNPRVIRN